MSYFNNPNDPEKIGPGIWIDYTKRSINALTDRLKNEWIEQFMEMCIHFNCFDCSGHCVTYMQLFPPDNCKNMKFIFQGKTYKCGLFYWIWKFHNAVNERKNKPIMPFETACKIFLTETRCSSC